MQGPVAAEPFHHQAPGHGPVQGCGDVECDDMGTWGCGYTGTWVPGGTRTERP